MKQLRHFWEFTRPHTIIGSAISVAALYLMASATPSIYDIFFWLSLLSALSCNVFITGYNQVVDVDLDRINKPNLPLASGKISLPTGKRLVAISLLLSLTSAFFIGLSFLLLIGTIALLGFFYSWKNVFLKRHHLTAAAAITIVRGGLINAGFYLHFAGIGFQIERIPPEIWLLIAFTSLFSLGIAWFKDIPDVLGDAKADINTLAVRSGIRSAYRIGVYTVASGYVIGAFAPQFAGFQLSNVGILTLGHGFFGMAFLSFAFRVDPENPERIRKFYKVFWLFFFLEYLLFITAFMLN